LILVFVVHHLARFHFDHPSPVSDLVRDNLSRPVTAWYYIFSLLILTIHLSHGFGSMAQTFGISHPRYDLLLNRLTLGLAVITGLVFTAIPIMALFWPGFLK
jgi:succinate dehydrogenase / fumarate reductase cytochrome b subunit